MLFVREASEYILRSKVHQRPTKPLHLLHRPHCNPAPFTTEMFPVLNIDIFCLHLFYEILFERVDIEENEISGGRNIF